MKTRFFPLTVSPIYCRLWSRIRQSLKNYLQIKTKIKSPVQDIYLKDLIVAKLIKFPQFTTQFA